MGSEGKRRPPASTGWQRNKPPAQPTRDREQGTSKAPAGRPQGKGGTKPPRQQSAAALLLAAQRRRIVAGAAAVVVLAAAGIAGCVVASGGSPALTTTSSTSSTTTLPKLSLAPLSTLGSLGSPGSPGPGGAEGVPVPNAPALASTTAAAGGQTVDGISCETSEQTLFHIHAHLTIFVNGSPRQIPYGIGIPSPQATSTPQGPFVSSGACFYWLHTHAPDGIIHIESPVARTFTLGSFFDEWGVPLGPDQLGPYKEPVTTLYDGEVYRGNPRDVPLEAHAQIQLEVGTPLVGPVEITFPSGL